MVITLSAWRSQSGIYRVGVAPTAESVRDHMNVLANLSKGRCPPLAAPASFAPTKQTKRKPSGVPFFIADREGAGEEEGGNIQHAARTQQPEILFFKGGGTFEFPVPR